MTAKRSTYLVFDYATGTRFGAYTAKSHRQAISMATEDHPDGLGADPRTTAVGSCKQCGAHDYDQRGGELRCPTCAEQTFEPGAGTDRWAIVVVGQHSIGAVVGLYVGTHAEARSVCRGQQEPVLLGSTIVEIGWVVSINDAPTTWAEMRFV